MKTIKREILLSLWKVHILHHASRGPVYGQWMLEELRRHGYSISPGTLYPLLRRMEEHGWLKSLSAHEGGSKERKDYILTEKGRKVLDLVADSVEELHREIRDLG